MFYHPYEPCVKIWHQIFHFIIKRSFTEVLFVKDQKTTPTYTSLHTHSVFTARKRSLRQGFVFTRVCDSVHRGGEYLGRYPRGRYTPLGRYTPWAGTLPLGKYTPLGRYTRWAGTPPEQVHPPG